MKKTVASRNVISREDFEKLEQKLGGPVKAARIAGVNPSTWWRWREGKLAMSKRTQKQIAMMLQTSTSPFEGLKRLQ